MNSWKLVSYIVFLSIIIFASIFILKGFTETANRINIRLSARIAGILFSLAFVASSFQYFVKGPLSFWLIANRRFIGISYALVFFLHLLLLIILQLSFHPVFEIAAISSLIGGGMAYLFTLLMLITSFDQFRNKIEESRWRLLHTIGGYWIWFIFIRTYWKRVTTEIEYLPLVILFIMVLLLRISKIIVKKKRPIHQ